jgi:hypothetical protein
MMPMKTIRTTLVSVIFRQLGSCFGLFDINTIYVHVIKYKNSFALISKQARRACQRLTFLSVCNTRTNKLYIVYINTLCTNMVNLDCMTDLTKYGKPRVYDRFDQIW